MEFHAEAQIEAPPSKVWSHLTDLSKASDWVPFLSSLVLLDEPPPKLGSRVRLVVALKGQAIETEAKVKSFDPERKLELFAEVPEVRSSLALAWVLEAAGAATRVRQTARLDFGSMMARLGAKAFLGDLLSKQTLEDSLHALKNEVEGS